METLQKRGFNDLREIIRRDPNDKKAARALNRERQRTKIVARKHIYGVG